MEILAGAGTFVPTTGSHWEEHLEVPDLSCGTYSLPAGGSDPQSAHTEDELYLVTRGTATLASVDWRAGDSLVFGSESAGLPAGVRAAFPPERLVRLPLLPGQRSLNLSNAVAVAVFEAWRRSGYAGSA